ELHHRQRKRANLHLQRPTKAKRGYFENHANRSKKKVVVGDKPQSIFLIQSRRWLVLH
ncbi:hypothetical protein Dimus_018194, partial [Dionaea muscipula]